MTKEEAIKTVKNNWPEGRLMLQEALQTLIPELNESEDERIRKALLKYLYERQIVETYTDTKVKQEWITWLEKQDEKETICGKCKKEHPSHFCQDITELGRCAIEHEQKDPIGNMLTLEKVEKTYDPTIPFLYTDLCTSKSYVELDGYRICVNDLFNKLPKEE